MGYFILLAFILILGNIVIANIDLETDKDSRKWKLLRENKQPKSIEFEKIEKIIWKMFLLQCYLIFAYSLFKCIQLIFSTEGEFLLKTSKLSYVVLFLSAVIGVITLFRILSISSKKYTFLNFEEDYKLNEKIGLFILAIPVFFAFLLYNGLFSENPFSFLNILTDKIFIDFGFGGGINNWTGSILGLWLTWGFLMAHSKLKSEINTKTFVYQLMSEQSYYFEIGGTYQSNKLKMQVAHPKPQNNTSIIFKEGQCFHVSFNENPSNSDEAETILITDANEHDFVVTKIQDKHLPYFLRKKEYELKAELKSIIGTKKLEIALWLEKI